MVEQERFIKAAIARVKKSSKEARPEEEYADMESAVRGY